MLGLPAARTAPLATLSPADVARYRQIFALQQEARFSEAQRIVQQLDSDLLMGHVLAQRYLHRKSAKTSYEELTGWLQRYADLPQALRIHRLAVSRAPRKAAPPPVPEGGYLEGAGQELKEESFSDSFMRRWNVGIAAWRNGDYGGAADQFMTLAKDPDRGGEELAAAAFWAGRAQLRARRPELVAGLLRKAARASDEFYGLMAQRLLDERIRFDWRREELRQEMVQLLVRYPAAKRAIALRQAGQLGFAEAEVRRLGGRTALPEDTQGADRSGRHPGAALGPDAPGPAAPARRRPPARRCDVPDPALGAAERVPARPHPGLRHRPRRKRFQHRGREPARGPGSDAGDAGYGCARRQGGEARLQRAGRPARARHEPGDRPDLAAPAHAHRTRWTTASST